MSAIQCRADMCCGASGIPGSFVIPTGVALTMPSAMPQAAAMSRTLSVRPAPNRALSRAASWLANIVARLTPAAYVSTVHGRQSVHASSRRFNVYGGHIMVVCEELVAHLRQELNITDAEIHVVRNPIE